MTNYIFTLCLCAGFFFGAWPLVMRASGLNSILAAFVLQVGTMLVVSPFLKGNVRVSLVLSAGMAVAIAAGIANGFGQLAFQKLISLRDVELARASITVVVMQIATTAIGARFFYAETFGWKKLLGCGFALIAVKLLIGK
ncbi:MAG: hypothetical protein HY435_02905 [Candidatus Liptonbacteria bacterium]|nr:hypothetical protein [Candidatus Liptonbacteria bacterium]